VLSVERLDAAYGESQVLWGVDLEVTAGRVVCLMGRNGVGKTTLLRAIMGCLPVRGGRVRLDGRDVTDWSPDRRARAGIGYVPQGREIFPHLSVAENLRIPLLGCGRATAVDDALDLFPALRPVLGRKGGVLSGGEQQMLAIGRAGAAHASAAPAARRADRGHSAVHHPRDRGCHPADPVRDGTGGVARRAVS